jgi:hypothetical protein
MYIFSTEKGEVVIDKGILCRERNGQVIMTVLDIHPFIVVCFEIVTF